MRQVHAVTTCSSIWLAMYHAMLFKLLVIALHQNCTIAGFEVCACTALSPYVLGKKNLFHKLIHVTKIFMRKCFMVQCHSQNIFNIKLFPNYGIYVQTLEKTAFI